MNAAAFRSIEELGKLCEPKGWIYTGAMRSAIDDNVHFYYEVEAGKALETITIDMNDFIAGKAIERLRLEIEKRRELLQGPPA